MCPQLLPRGIKKLRHCIKVYDDNVDDDDDDDDDDDNDDDDEAIVTPLSYPLFQRVLPSASLLSSSSLKLRPLCLNVSISDD